MSKPFLETRQRLLKFRKSKWTGKRSDGVVEREKDHHCGGGRWLCLGGNEATRGRSEQKVTHAAKKRSDGASMKPKDHHCARGSKATEAHSVQKVTHALKKRSDRGVARVRGHHCVGGT